MNQQPEIWMYNMNLWEEKKIRKTASQKHESREVLRESVFPSNIVT